jgi:hypothetical protein
MKLVSYSPKDVTNVAAFMNKYLDDFKDEKFIMFAFNDVVEKMKDKEDVIHKYEELLVKLDLPYAFFPYYAHFNKILPNLINRPSPRITVKMKDGYVFDVVQEPAFGMLILNIEKLNSIGFKFNEEYKMSFYIQDLILKCSLQNLYISQTYFIDVHKSYEMFDSDFRHGFMMDSASFIEEKKKFFEHSTGIKNEQINDYVKALKERYTVIEPEVVE